MPGANKKPLLSSLPVPAPLDVAPPRRTNGKLHPLELTVSSPCDTFDEPLANLIRGWTCLAVCLCSVAIVLAQPRGLLFWRHTELAFESSGLPGFLVSCMFLFYLVTDTMVVLTYRKQIKRPIAPVVVHHVVVGMGTFYYLPSPPRALFVYIWGEVLTACRCLPPQYRWPSRGVTFGLRRVIWIYLVLRDTYCHQTLREGWGVVAALIAPVISVLLLYLDAGWWREHCKAGQAEAAVKGTPASTQTKENKVE